jgi:hypothetical protein
VKGAEHSQIVARAAASEQSFAKEVYCTVTFAVYVHTGLVSLPTKLA